MKLNLKNPAVVDYILDTVKFWREEFGIDGLRLDVATAWTSTSCAACAVSATAWVTFSSWARRCTATITAG
mgnify:CR=1 FL=1